MKSKKKYIIIGAIAISAIILALATCAHLIILNNLGIEKGNFIKFVLERINITKCTIISLIYFIIGYLFYYKGQTIGNFIYKFRFLLAGITFLLCIIFEISGSSIGMWKYCVGNDLTTTGDILGTARAIRGDEWVVFTPLALSQDYNKPDNYQYFSNIVRGEKTDVFIVYGQPVKDISMIFRPFQLGYLLLGSSRGLSFYWCGRYIALFLVSFELGMLITKKRKDLSLILAVLMLLSPAVQWWFSVNGFVEMIVFGGLGIILLQKYMTTNKFLKRLIYLIITAICAGGFILAFYPAWQIPMAYIILGLGIWVIIENRKQCTIKAKDILSIIAVVAIFLVLMLNILIKSKDTIKSVMNTAYPGARCETGGEMGLKYFTYPTNLFFTFDDNNLNTNVCEAAVFFDLFPIGLILTAIVLFKEKKKDSLLTILLILTAIFEVWCTIGLPKILAKITLLYVSPARRTFVVVGIINTLMLIRAMALIKKPLSQMSSIAISLISMIVVITLCINAYPNYFSTLQIAITMIVLIVLYYLVLRYKNETNKNFLIPAIVVVMMFMSFLINPIRKGIEVVTEQPVGKAIKQIEEQKSGLWIVEGRGYPLMNYAIMYGAPTLNSTNTYPDLEKWYKLDPDKKYENLYNRYAHIVTKIVDTNDDVPKFEYVDLDSFKINLTVEDLKELNINYVLTVNDLTEYDDETINFNELYIDYGMRIYEINYIK